MKDEEKAREFFGCEEQCGGLVHTEFCSAYPRGPRGCEALAALLARVREAERGTIARMEESLRWMCEFYCRWTAATRWYDGGEPKGMDGAAVAYELVSMARAALSRARKA